MPLMLSPRQLEILKLLAQGWPDKQIARELVLALGTVKWHNRQIFNKLGVDNRTQAVASARELGLLDPSPVKSRQGAPSRPPGTQAVQRIYFTTSYDGVRLAYGVSGSGPPLVKAAHFLNHLEHDWVSPVWRHWMEAFSRRFRYIRYDERGTGLSDWEVADLSFDSWVRDLEAVVEAAGLNRFPIIGASQGGPVAIAYASAHPERVSHLILYGAYAGGPPLDDPAADRETEALLGLMEIGWARDNPAFRRTLATMFIPEATLEELESFEEIMRLSASTENAIKLRAEMERVDVVDMARNLRVPTLVVHARRDAVVGYESGRRLATLIPGAQFVTLESQNHILRAREPAWAQFLNAIQRFIDDRR